LAGETSGRPGRLALGLLIANVAVFAAFMAWDHWGHLERDLPELNPEKIRLLDRPPEKTRPAPVAGTPSSPATAAESGVAPLCYAVEGMTPARNLELREALAKLGDARGAYALISEVALPWWVFWPPEYEAAQRDAVLKKLTQAEIKDFLAIGKGPMAQSFSLGMFPTEAQAMSHRDRLRQKGLDKAEYGIRAGIDARLRFVVDTPGRAEAVKGVLPVWVKPADCPS